MEKSNETKLERERSQGKLEEKVQKLTVWNNIVCEFLKNTFLPIDERDLIIICDLFEILRNYQEIPRVSNSRELMMQSTRRVEELSIFLRKIHQNKILTSHENA